ncbi:MAG: DMT family transporter [Sneathiella sp.]
MQQTNVNKPLGFLAALAVVVLWSGWIVTSRSGAQSPLTIYDMAALRYGISGLIALPIVLYFKPWRNMSLKRMIIVSQLPGIPYILVVYAAFTYAPASHGGVFMNGILPVLTLALMWIWIKEKPQKYQMVGTILILLGCAIAAMDGSDTASGTAWIGDILFILAGLSFALYMITARHWGVTSMQVLFCSSVINGAIFVPLWLAFLPTGMYEATYAEIGLQALYQGVLATLFGMVLVAYASRNIGAAATAAVMSAVPAISALLGSQILGESFAMTGWLSIAILTPGIILTAAFSRSK